MSSFNERHPPMGSEWDADATNTSSIDQYSAYSSSSSEEPDELSLRVRALLAASDDDDIPEFLSSKESSVYEECQVNPQSNEIGSHSQVPYNSRNLECHYLQDNVILPKEEERVTDNRSTIKDSTSKTNKFYDDHEKLLYECNVELLEEKKVSFDNQSEKHKAKDLFSSSDPIIIKDSNLDMHQCSVLSDQCVEEHDIFKDSTSYSLEDDLKERCCETNPLQLSTSFYTSRHFFYHTPSENEEKLSADETSDYSHFTSGLSAQVGDKEEYCSLSRTGDCDTSSLSISNITSSKQLEWDNAADIGYATDATSEKISHKKSRKEPEGLSLAAHKISYGTSIKFSKNVNQHFSAKNTSVISEKELTSQVSQTLDLHDRSHVSASSISNIKRDFATVDTSVDDKTLEFSSTQPSMVSESINSHKKPQLQIRHDLSVRPKDTMYMKRTRHPERRNILPKDQSFILEESTKYSKDKKPVISKNDVSKSMHENRDIEIQNRRVSFVSTPYIERSNIVTFTKPEGHISPIRSFEHHPCQPVSDLPKEYQNRILSGPIFIDHDILVSNENNNRPPIDSSISSSEIIPHIRWYPIPSDRSSQDIRNASTQTSVLTNKLGENATEGSDVVENELSLHVRALLADDVEHLCVTRTVNRNPVNRCSCPPEWQLSEDVSSILEFTSKDVGHSYMQSYSSVPDKVDEYMEEMSFNNLLVNIKKVDEDGANSTLLCDSDDNDTNSPGSSLDIEKDKEEFTDIPTSVITKDASTQTEKCDCFNEFKNMLIKSLSKVTKQQVHPFHRPLEEWLRETQQTTKVSPNSKKYDILFLNDDTPKILDAERSPLNFSHILRRPLRCEMKSPVKRNQPQRLKQLSQKKISKVKQEQVRASYRMRAKHFCKELAKSAGKGKVHYALNERILKSSP